MHVCMYVLLKMRKRPLSVWKRLLEIIGIQKVCHVGEPDYENNFNAKVLKSKCGPEPEDIVYNRSVCLFVRLYIR